MCRKYAAAFNSTGCRHEPPGSDATVPNTHKPERCSCESDLARSKHRVSVNLTPDDLHTLDDLQGVMEARFNPSQIPSVSLLFSYALLKFAEEVQREPGALCQAMAEMVCRGYSPSPKLLPKQNTPPQII